MRIIIAGSRTIIEKDVVEAIQACPWIGFISVVVSGTAKGADQYGEKWAKENKVDTNRYPAEWEKHGRRAGPMRNKVMAENAEGLIAIWDGKSRGTLSMIDLAKKFGLRIAVFHTDSKKLNQFPPSGDLLDIWEYTEERAAIFEYEDGLPRLEAERRAGIEGWRQRCLKQTKSTSDIPEFNIGSRFTAEMFNTIIGIMEFIAAKFRVPIQPHVRFFIGAKLTASDMNNFVTNVEKIYEHIGWPIPQWSFGKFKTGGKFQASDMNEIMRALKALESVGEKGTQEPEN